MLGNRLQVISYTAELENSLLSERSNKHANQKALWRLI